MHPTVPKRDAAAGWDVVRPTRPSLVPGVSMAGFHDRDSGPFDLRSVPHPAVTVAFEFGDSPLVIEDASGRRQRGSLVAGLGPGVRVSGKNIECVQVRLTPMVAHAVLGVCPSELERAVVALDDLWGRDASRILERLGATQSWDERFALTEAALVRRRASGPTVDREVAWVWDRMVVNRGWVRVDELAVEIGWSRKRLWTRFRSQIGMPPKRAAKLIRFDHAAHRLSAGHGAASVAAETGYVDQSHLHRDVLEFTGGTPSTMVDDTWLAVDHIAW
jgi:AraC-like DNA-binding protein